MRDYRGERESPALWKCGRARCAGAGVTAANKCEVTPGSPRSPPPYPSIFPSTRLAQVQTAAVNMLNLATSQPDLGVRAKASLGEERSVVPALMALLDHSLPVLRAKGLVAILLLCR